jgi:hypothetical protein
MTESRRQAEANNHPEPVTVIDPTVRFNDLALPPCGQGFQMFDLSDVCVALRFQACLPLVSVPIAGDPLQTRPGGVPLWLAGQPGPLH